MGNRIRNLFPCSAGSGDVSGRFDNGNAFLSNQRDKTLGDSAFYVRPPNPHRFSGNVFTNEFILTTFRSVSSVIVGANSSLAPSNLIGDSLQQSTVLDSSASFESSGSFILKKMVMLPPQPQCIPSRGLNNDNGSIKKGSEPSKNKISNRILKKIMSGSFLKTVSREKRATSENNGNANNGEVGCELKLRGAGDGGVGGSLLMGCRNLHWARGRAGEDRLHIVICENHGWIFTGIYDGFHGADATDYLLNNLYRVVVDELKGQMCGHDFDKVKSSFLVDSKEKVLLLVKEDEVDDSRCYSSSSFKENHLIRNDNLDRISEIVKGMNSRNNNEGVHGDEMVDLEKRTKVKLGLAKARIGIDCNHSNDVLRALSEAMKKTEDAFMKIVDEMIGHNPELAMMGSCVLVMLMMGEDVYLMNVGDSRAVLATQGGNPRQLTMDHNTNVKEEVHRIMMEHLDDPFAVTRGRVKGSLSVTRAFGAGFLKQPKLNDAVLETFKVNYLGDSPYMTCCPSLLHHKLTPNDKFLILSSDGIYQYFTNEEAVAKVEYFIAMFPDRDPAQLLIEEALSRAAKKAGMSFHQLLDIPQGERRLYHDDISIVIISLEGKFWHSIA